MKHIATLEECEVLLKILICHLAVNLNFIHIQNISEFIHSEKLGFPEGLAYSFQNLRSITYINICVKLFYK